MSIFSFVKAGKKTFEIVKPKIAKRLTEKRKDTDQIFDIRKKSGLPPSRDAAKTVKKVSAINERIDKILEKKAKGGRIGYKRGTGLMPKKKSSIDKIKKTFGPKSLGMQSVIYGLDKNPKITKADPKAKFIAAANKKKKKVI
jgi:hypothetical protein